MWNGRRFKGRTQSDALSSGNVRIGEIDCGKGEKSRITMGIPNQFQLLSAIQHPA